MASPSKPIKTKEQRQKDAQEALNTIDKDGKKSEAKEYLEYEYWKSKADLGTRCMIYNATGDTIKYVNHHNWRGFMFSDTMPKPHTEVKNGEWHCFVHVGVGKAGYTHIDPVSIGSALYRVQMDTGKFCDVFFAWDTNNYRGQVNKAYVEVRERFHFTSRIHDVKNSMDRHNKSDSCDRAFAYKAIAENQWGYAPIYEGIITLEGLKIKENICKQR